MFSHKVFFFFQALVHVSTAYVNTELSQVQNQIISGVIDGEGFSQGSRRNPRLWRPEKRDDLDKGEIVQHTDRALCQVKLHAAPRKAQSTQLLSLSTKQITKQATKSLKSQPTILPTRANQTTEQDRVK